MKQEENLVFNLIGNQNKYNNSCIFANSGTGHTVYCDNREETAPRKCIYRMSEENMCNCPLFSKNPDNKTLHIV